MDSDTSVTDRASRDESVHEVTEKTIVVPVTQETITIDRETIETGRVVVRKMVEEQDHHVVEALLREEAVIERVRFDTVLDQPARVRHEGDTLIIPIMEEVLVVEKRLMLREEVRVKLVQETTQHDQHVLLRREDVQIDRTGLDEPLPNTGR